MIRTFLQHDAATSRRREAAGRGGAAARRGFSLVELLVVMSIMVVLLGLVGAAVSGARANSKRQATQLLIEKLDAIVQQHFSSYSSRNVALPATPSGFPGASAYRSWHIRRNLITGDMPDRWTDVAALASGATPAYGSVRFPITLPQQTYAAVYRGMQKGNKQPTDQYAGAECLFMIVMQGGLASCTDCGELKSADRGDKDNDGAFEFWDAWGNPIGFILWPAGLQLPPGTGTKFFSGGRSPETAFPPRGVTPSPTLGMRPLIYSAGPDGEYGFNRASEASNLLAGSGSVVGLDCGNPAAEPTAGMASPEPANGALAADNITNLDAEAVR